MLQEAIEIREWLLLFLQYLPAIQHSIIVVSYKNPEINEIEEIQLV